MIRVRKTAAQRRHTNPAENNNTDDSNTINTGRIFLLGVKFYLCSFIIQDLVLHKNILLTPKVSF